MGRIVPSFIQRFVCAHIDCAYGDGQTLHAFNGTSVLLELFFFIWQMTLPAHEQKLTAEKSNPNSTHQQSGAGIFWHFNVRKQFNFLAIQGD